MSCTIKNKIDSCTTAVFHSGRADPHNCAKRVAITMLVILLIAAVVTLLVLYASQPPPKRAPGWYLCVWQG